MAYTITWLKHGFYARFSGTLTMEELIESNHKFYNDSRSSNARYQIFDFLDIEEFRQAAMDPKYFAITDKASNSYISKIKLALVADNDDIADLCREYINISKKLSSNWSFELFDNLAEARQWAEPE